jgi:hypothetical protein
LNQEIARQFSTEGGKSSRSGKVTFADPIKAKMWAAAAKFKLASLTHKPPKSTESHPSKLFSAKPLKQSVSQFQRLHSLMVKPSQVEKYSGVVKNFSLPIV